MIRVGVVGASGYSGIVAARLLAAHPNASLAFCTSDKWTGDRVASRIGVPVHRDLRFIENGRCLEEGADVDVVLLATAAEISLDLAPKLIAASGTVRVIDLSGAFRLRDGGAYRNWYGFEHKQATLLAHAHYGLPELFGAPARDSRLVANPGCYPTPAIVSLAPLLREGLVERTGIVIDAKSGVTGAGRQAKEAYSFVEVDGDFRAYKLLSHQHTPEIAQGIGASVTFTAHLLPVRRGLLTTAYARPVHGVTTAQLVACLRAAYDGAPFVEIVDPGEVTLASVVGTNMCRVGVVANEHVVIAIGAIDNLIKGAAGQAVQNMNLWLGLPETTGLVGLHRSSP